MGSMPGSFSPKGALAPYKDDEYTPTPSIRMGEPSDAFSLHNSASAAQSTDRLFDEDPTELQTDDLPPLYTDDPDAPVPDPLLAGSNSYSRSENRLPYYRKDPGSGHEYYIDRRLDTDPTFLQKHVETCALSPPRLFARVYGSHYESVRKGEQTRKETKVDFDVKVEITPFLYGTSNGGIASAANSWRELRSANNFSKVRRGTVFPTRAPGFGGASIGGVALEEGQPGLPEWCHRYCASHAGLKTFLLRKEVTGFDEDLVQKKLENLVRATGYRGTLHVMFPVKDDKVEVYNECRTNQWRLLKWVQWLFMFTLLFLVTWPWLFFRTARFEVITAEWPFSVRKAGGSREYVSVSEEQWYNMWARAIRKAVLERRQGTLDQSDLIAAEGFQGGNENNGAGENAGGGEEGNTGGGGGGGGGSFVRAGVNAMNAVNQHFGWGGNS